MGKQTNQYTKTRTAANSQAQDRMDWDSTEDGGTTFESAQMTRDELILLVIDNVDTIYTANSQLTGHRIVDGQTLYDLDFLDIDSFEVNANDISLASVSNTAIGVGGHLDLFANDGVGINLTTPPDATLDILADGSTSATKAIRVENSLNESLFIVRDDGFLGVNTLTPSSALNPTYPTSSVKLEVQDGALSISDETNPAALYLLGDRSNLIGHDDGRVDALIGFRTDGGAFGANISVTNENGTPGKMRFSPTNGLGEESTTSSVVFDFKSNPNLLNIGGDVANSGTWRLLTNGGTTLTNRGHSLFTYDSQARSTAFTVLEIGHKYDNTSTNKFTGIHIKSPSGTPAVFSNKYALVTDSGAGNVGIGTTSPTEKLHCIDKIRSNTAFNLNGTDGIGAVGGTTYTFGGGGTGDVASMTFRGGILTAVTTVP
jgi:hypothetical protein